MRSQHSLNRECIYLTLATREVRLLNQTERRLLALLASEESDQAMLLLNNFCICKGAPGRTGFVVHIEDERKTIIMAAGINLNSNSSQAYRVILTFICNKQMVLLSENGTT